MFNRAYPGTKANGKGKGRGVFRLPDVMLSQSSSTHSNSQDRSADALHAAEHPRIMSLRSPTSKMSKSAPHPASKILLTDSFADIRSKLKSAVTDSTPGITYDPVHRPGIATLLQIHSGYSGEGCGAIAARFDREGGIRALKEETADAVESVLGPFRVNFERVRAETGYLEEREKEGARRASEVASGVLAEVKRAVGTD